ncbi:hypothetical protein Tco_1104194 [Tanacetum coccineum]
MAQQQHAADVHLDELCPPNKRYDLMDANKKVNLDHVQCLSESKILTNIIKNHPLRFSIALLHPFMDYMAQIFWHTLNEDGSKSREAGVVSISFIFFAGLKMVNTRTDAELAAAVQAAVDAMLLQIREQVRKEYRTGASGSNPPPVTIHTWLERFNKQKPHSFEKAVAPVDAEN